MKLIFAPISIVLGLIAGLSARRPSNRCGA